MDNMWTLDAIEGIKQLIKAIEDNVEQINVGDFYNGRDKYAPIVRLQYIADEIEELKKLIK